MTEPQIRLDPSYYQKNSIYAWLHTLVPLSAYFFLLAVSSCVVSWYESILMVVLLGYIQYRIHFSLHDCTHYSLFKTQFMNRFWGTIMANLLFTTFESFRNVHLKHHSDLGHPDDPGSIDYWVRFNSRTEMLRFLLLPLFGGLLIFKVREYMNGLIIGAGRRSGASREYMRQATQLVSLLCIQAGLFYWLTDAGHHVWRYVVFCVLPTVTVFLFFSRLRMFIEHGSLDYAELDYLSCPQPVARTIPSMLPERPVFCALNFNYHHEHHRYPQVPSCNLKKLHDDVTNKYLKTIEFETTYWGSLVKLWKNLGCRKNA